MQGPFWIWLKWNTSIQNLLIWKKTPIRCWNNLIGMPLLSQSCLWCCFKSSVFFPPLALKGTSFTGTAGARHRYFAWPPLYDVSVIRYVDILLWVHYFEQLESRVGARLLTDSWFRVNESSSSWFLLRSRDSRFGTPEKMSGGMTWMLFSWWDKHPG